MELLLFGRESALCIPTSKCRGVVREQNHKGMIVFDHALVMNIIECKYRLARALLAAVGVFFALVRQQIIE